MLYLPGYNQRAHKRLLLIVVARHPPTNILNSTRDLNNYYPVVPALQYLPLEPFCHRQSHNQVRLLAKIITNAPVQLDTCFCLSQCFHISHSGAKPGISGKNTQ